VFGRIDCLTVPVSLSMFFLTMDFKCSKKPPTNLFPASWNFRITCLCARVAITRAHGFWKTTFTTVESMVWHTTLATFYTSFCSRSSSGVCSTGRNMPAQILPKDRGQKRVAHRASKMFEGFSCRVYTCRADLLANPNLDVRGCPFPRRPESLIHLRRRCSKLCLMQYS
jgi:hypothetical protein